MPRAYYLNFQIQLTHIELERALNSEKLVKNTKLSLTAKLKKSIWWEKCVKARS
jgi:hypothetical protein